MISRPLGTFACSLAFSTAAVSAGPGTAEWISASVACPPGSSVSTGIRLVMDAGWHTYWSNPGEGGMKISVKWELPPGWKAGELEHPAPIRFMTGELPGFGYTGTVVFPVKLTAPTDFSGSASLKAEVSWLACNDDSCVPGNAALTLDIVSGAIAATRDAPALEQAARKIPTASPDLSLVVSEKPKSLILTLTAKPAAGVDPAACEIFPATPQAIDAAAKIHFKNEGKAWTADVAKSEYAPEKIAELTLVFVPKSGAAQPVSVTWKSPPAAN